MTHANSITFDLAWYSILSRYSASIRRTVCDAVLNFAATGEKPSLKGVAKLAFAFISHEISKQLGKLAQETISQPDTCPNDSKTDMPEAVNVLPYDTPAESIMENNNEPAINTEDLTKELLSEDSISEKSPESQPEETVLQTDDNAAELQHSIDSLPAMQQCKSNIDCRPAQQAKSPEHNDTAHALPSRKKTAKSLQHCNRTIGKVVCKRKGAKIIFRKR